jgi:glycosyltransferase involved in cell wall biosynthesis
MIEPLVSIIVPAFNAEAYVDDALSSIQKQIYSNWECIIVNDGSTDNSKQVIESFIKADSRFQLINIENSGVCVARNTAVRHSQGVYILPLDADDKIAPGYIEKAVRVFDQNPTVKLVYCQAEFFGTKKGLWELPVYNFEKLLLYNHIFCSAFFRKVDFLKIGGYDESLIHGWEDWDLWIKLLNTKAEVYRIEDILFFYRIKNESRSITIDTDNEKAILSRIRIFENNREAYIDAFYDPVTAYRELELAKTELHAIKKSKLYRLYFSLKGLFFK